jgi:hypothetical protein
LSEQFALKYAELIDPEYPIPSTLDETYYISRDSTDAPMFIHFHPWENILRKASKSTNKNWKGRLSIHPEDLEKSWEIIFPILARKKICFKVAKLEAIEKLINDRQEKLEKLIEEYNQFLQDSSTQDISSLRNTFHRTYHQLATYSFSEWRLISFIQASITLFKSFFYQHYLNRENLVAYTKTNYEHLIDLRKQKFKNALRFHEGMQFSIYILPGHEQDCKNTLEEIEDNLVKAKIRPGKIFPTDRQLGIYSSIRHPGRWHYHKATDNNLQTYNPDNIEDPFVFLRTAPAMEVIQESEIQTMLENRDSPQLIISALKTYKFITPSQFKALAMHKENVVEHIKSLSLDAQEEVVNESLDKSTNLGKFFRVQRGMFCPNLTRGTLKQLDDIRLTIRRF